LIYQTYINHGGLLQNASISPADLFLQLARSSIYSVAVDHDMDSCGPLITISAAIETLFVSVPQLFSPTLTINFNLAASLNVYMSSVHGHSQVQTGGRCSSMSPASLPTSSLAYAISSESSLFSIRENKMLQGFTRCTWPTRLLSAVDCEMDFLYAQSLLMHRNFPA